MGKRFFSWMQGLPPFPNLSSTQTVIFWHGLPMERLHISRSIRWVMPVSSVLTQMAHRISFPSLNSLTISHLQRMRVNLPLLFRVGWARGVNSGWQSRMDALSSSYMQINSTTFPLHVGLQMAGRSPSSISPIRRLRSQSVSYG